MVVLERHYANMPEKAPASLLSVRGRAERIPTNASQKALQGSAFCFYAHNVSSIG